MGVDHHIPRSSLHRHVDGELALRRRGSLIRARRKLRVKDARRRNIFHRVGIPLCVARPKLSLKLRRVIPDRHRAVGHRCERAIPLR